MAGKHHQDSVEPNTRDVLWSFGTAPNLIVYGFRDTKGIAPTDTTSKGKWMKANPIWESRAADQGVLTDTKYLHPTPAIKEVSTSNTEDAPYLVGRKNSRWIYEVVMYQLHMKAQMQSSDACQLGQASTYSTQYIN